MDILVQHFKESLSAYESDAFFSPRILRSWATFDKYYLKTEDSPFYAAAIILHPGRRTGYLKHNWEKKWVRPAIQAVQQLWERFKSQDSSIFMAASYGIPLRPLRPGARPGSDQSKTVDLDEFDILAQGLDNFPRPQSKDELEEYSSEPAITISTSALAWWLDSQQRQRWPKLSQLAINILSIPAMSAETERVFSGARRTISWERTRLSVNTIEMVECLKHWKRSGLIERIMARDEDGELVDG